MLHIYVYPALYSTATIFLRGREVALGVLELAPIPNSLKTSTMVVVKCQVADLCDALM